MKYVVLLAILLLTGAWGYISWYWYTCNIKGLCQDDAGIHFLASKDTEPSGFVVPKMPTISMTDSSSQVDRETSSLQSGDDIQTQSYIPKPEETTTQPETPKTCSPIITEPIQYGAKNNPVEVESLEIFLNTQGSSVPIDGEYGQEDLAAVKAFQETYRADILDPWGIKTPNGYVYKTTMEKINSIACAN